MIHFVSLTEADKSGLLDQIPQSIRFKSFHLISPSGDIQSGAEALIDLITLLPLGHSISKLIILLPSGIQMTKFFYKIFSRSHDKDSCHFRGKDTSDRKYISL